MFIKKDSEKQKRKKVLVIVAHPDDETIWMGGTILLNKDWDIKIISLCRKNDADRAPKFSRVCQLLKAKGCMSDLEDEKHNDISEEEIITRINQFAEREYDYIFTHGKNGEYGHKRHVDVYKAVIRMLKEKQLICKKIFFFSYTRKGKYCYPDKNSDTFISLKNSSYSKKKNLIMEVYGFNKGGFEEICCRQTESFKSKNIQ